MAIRDFDERIRRSMDTIQGLNWSVQYLASERSGSLSKIKFIDRSVGWAIGESLILHTTDGGRHWTEQWYDEGDYLFDIESVSAASLWAVGGNGLLLHTIDGGKTWQRNSLQPDWHTEWFSKIVFIDGVRGWVFGDNGLILATTDAGISWRLESRGTSDYLHAAAATLNAVFAAGNDGVILKRAR